MNAMRFDHHVLVLSEEDIQIHVSVIETNQFTSYQIIGSSVIQNDRSMIELDHWLTSIGLKMDRKDLKKPLLGITLACDGAGSFNLSQPKEQDQAINFKVEKLT